MLKLLLVAVLFGINIAASISRAPTYKSNRCNPGSWITKYANGGQLVQSCSPCRPGTFTAAINSLACSKCAQGTYNPSKGQTSCSPCRPGTFTAAISSLACSKCAQGTYNPSKGQTSCSSCRPGTVSSSDRTKCANVAPTTAGEPEPPTAAGEPEPPTAPTAAGSPTAEPVPETEPEKAPTAAGSNEFKCTDKAAYLLEAKSVVTNCGIGESNKQMVASDKTKLCSAACKKQSDALLAKCKAANIGGNGKQMYVDFIAKECKESPTAGEPEPPTSPPTSETEDSSAFSNLLSWGSLVVILLHLVC